MQQAEKNHSPAVRRITIDEKLDAGLMRFLVSNLKPGILEFDDAADCWGKEEEILVSPDNLKKEIELPLDTSRKWTWDNLFEGQTFLEGYFTLKSSEPDCLRFLVDYKEKRLMCINDLIKDSIKQIYFSAIKGENES